MSRVSGAELAIRALRAHGVDTIFTIVGDHTLPLCDHAIDYGIRFVDTRHESAAVHMADAWSRATGRPGVCVVTGGPGHANSLAGLAVASRQEVPVIHISGRSELAYENMDALQELDQISTAAPLSKRAEMVRNAAAVPDAIHAAFRSATGGRPGPAHITIPLDVQEATVDESDAAKVDALGTAATVRSGMDANAANRVLEILQSARRPVIVAGAGAAFGVDPSSLQGLVEITGIPLFTVETARGLVDDRHDLCLGYADPALNHAARHIAEADVLLLLGKKFDFRLAYGRPSRIGRDTRVLQVDPDPDEIGRYREVEIGLCADVGTVVVQLAKAARKLDWQGCGDWVDLLNAARNEQLQEMAEAGNDHELPLHPMTVVEAVKPFLDESDFLIFDTGDYVQWGRSYLDARRPGRWLRLGPLGHLGAGLPLALGCQVADPDSRSVLFIGDGGVGFYFMEFDTAVRHNLPIIAIVGNDSAWGIDRQFQLAYYGRSVATDLRPVRYDRLVTELGGHGEYVERPEEFGGAFERAWTSGKPALINVAIRSITSPLSKAMIERRMQSHPKVCDDDAT
jgi:acetolactate synthase-1/2/3 large subunit